MSRLLVAGLAFVALALGIVFVRGAPANATVPDTDSGTPITSADPNKPVPFVWSTVQTHFSGSLLRLQGGTLHAIPAAVRLIGPGGEVVATSDTRPVGAGEAGLCGEGATGLVAADLAVSRQAVEALGAQWPANYSLEAQVGGEWRATTLTFAGCLAME
ncbi:MAG: hypothetical protein ACYC4L_01480 [Chloroflexota bacterium]